MTEVIIEVTDRDICLIADEHAGDSTICAVCSANVCNLINILEHEQEHHRLEYLRWSVNSGHSEVTARSDAECMDRFGAITDMVTIAFNALAESYPQHVKVTVR